ncbi:MAG: hypothetical protein V9F46_11715 [Chitinophagaceae bacterium]
MVDRYISSGWRYIFRPSALGDCRPDYFETPYDHPNRWIKPVSAARHSLDQKMPGWLFLEHGKVTRSQYSAAPADKSADGFFGQMSVQRGVGKITGLNRSMISNAYPDAVTHIVHPENADEFLLKQTN